MVLNYSDMKKNESIFRGFTGVTVEEFEELERKAEPIWVEKEKKRLARKERMREEGGGRNQALDFQNQLLMTLVWMKLYLVLNALGYLFGVDKSSASRYIARMRVVLREVGEETLGWPEQERRGHGRKLEQIWGENPDLFAYVDATEQRIQRSKDKEKQKKDYSGKKKAHTRKTQIVVNEDGVVRDVSESTEGSLHDRKHFTHSGVSEKIPVETIVAGDSGYQGIQRDLPDHSVITPFKNSKHHPLTDEQKLLNQEFSSGRIIVENTLAQFKHFEILSQRFRHSVDIYDDVFRSVLAIVNPRILNRVSSASTA